MRLLLSVGLAFLLVPSAPGCSSGPACAVDTDCPLGNRCDTDGTCHEVGEVRDSGPAMLDAGARDAPSTDARADVSEGGPIDGGAPDVGSDAGASTCPATAGDYPLTMVGVGCSGLTAARLTLTETTPPMDCTFVALLDGTTSGGFASSGTVAMDQLLGMLSFAGGSPVRCVATFTAAGAVDVVCDDGCSFSAMRAPGP